MAAGARVRVAYGSDALSASPTYTVIDDTAGVTVNNLTTKRGRQYFTDRTNAGTASIKFSDTKGALDPTHSAGPFYPQDPNCPIQVQLQNACTLDWVTIYTGLVQDIPTVIRFDNAPVNQGTIDAADLFSLLAQLEVPPGLDFASDGTGGSSNNTIGDTTYAPSTVEDRILSLLTDAGVPTALAPPGAIPGIFTGNVNVQAVVYQPGYKILAAIQDAADAEFPGISNFFVDKNGILNFRGRLARFNTGPGNPYGINTWKVGDLQAIASDSQRAVLQSITLDRDVTKVINSALCSPARIANYALPGQVLADATSIAKFGNRYYTAQNLLTSGGETDGNNANQETYLYSQYFVDNFKNAQTRVTQATFQQLRPDHPNAVDHWNFLCNVEIGDLIEITTTHPGGGGFSNELYFVEGISYSISPGGLYAGVILPQILLTLDLSPQAYFTTEPWEDPH